MTKQLLALKPVVRTAKKKLRYCITCENLATQEASFDVGENITSIEKYCDKCAMRILR